MEMICGRMQVAIMDGLNHNLYRAVSGETG
jgi:hypothetical protein